MVTLLRTIFMGTPDFAVPSLRALHFDPRVEVKLVVVQPDRPAGRGRKVRAQPVAATASELGLPLFQPETLRDPAVVARLAAVDADLCVVAAYGQILRSDVLGLPRLGCVNVHASLLPRWRGAAPIHRAIAAGDAVTGVSIMQMERGLDTGPVFAMSPVMIGDTETAGELHDRLADLGASLLVETLDPIADPERSPTPQPNARTTYARMLGAEDRVIDFDRPAPLVAATINGMSPWPGACVICDDSPITLLRARAIDADAVVPPATIVESDPARGLHVACAPGLVEVLEVKRPGKRAMPIADCLRGATLPVGTSLEAP